MIKIRVCLVLCIALVCCSDLQAQDSTLASTHQIGLHASEFLKLLEEDDSAYKISYRYTLNHKNALRAGLNYQHLTRDDGEFEASVRLGYDRVFLAENRWSFYFGGDVLLGYTSFNSSKRKTYQMALSPFIGFLFYLSPRFSLSTEPRFVALYHQFQDDDTFTVDNSDAWFEFGLSSIGQFNINFHF